MSTALLPPKRPPSRTKIVATLGPTSSTTEKIEELLRAGVDVFRLNSAHGSIEVLQQRLDAVRQVSRSTGVPVAVLVDLAGPKIRLGELPGDRITCKTGEKLTFVRGSGPVPACHLTATYPSLIDELEPEDRVMLADGTVELRVQQKAAWSRAARSAAGRGSICPA
jgi:pyruvate kinase